LWALELTHPLHPNTSDLIAWLRYILALSASSALLCTFSTSKTHPFCLQQIVLWPVSRRALWSVCKTKVGSDICFWLCCLADMILGIQCLVHLVTGAASSQHSATAAPAVHSIAGECRQEGFVHNHVMCATSSVLWSTTASPRQKLSMPFAYHDTVVHPLRPLVR